jgi:hypothetical protein
MSFNSNAKGWNKMEKTLVTRIKRDNWEQGYPVYSSPKGWFVGSVGPWPLRMVLAQAQRLGDTAATKVLSGE